MSESAMPVALLDWKPMKRNSLRGFATVRIGKALKVSDVAVHAASGRRWAQMPSKPQMDKNGTALREDSGKIKYVPMVQWTDRESADRFSEAVVAAVEAKHPGDTEAD